jgi:hypothetical protein
MGVIPIPAPVSGGVMLSYRCQARCRHCMYGCCPDWSADWITPARLEHGLAQLAPSITPSPYGPEGMGLNHGLHFSGGEPFLNFDLLLRAAGIAQELGIPSTFVETNCFWCTDDDSAHEELTALRGAGLRGIMISVNPFYAEHVPFERTERAIRISAEVFGRNVAVYQLEYYWLFREMGLSGKLTAEQALELSRSGSRSPGVELFVMGRATRALRSLCASAPAERFLREPCLPPVLRPWHNHFDNYGNFMPGYCGGISLGSWFELDELLSKGIDPEHQPVLALLLREDLGGLLAFAQERGYAAREDGYVSRCDLCLDVRAFLVSAGDFPELAPREFYDHLG